MSKVVFLDFDGVIRLPVLGTVPLESEFSSAHVGRLRQLVEETGAQVVVSSDWRLRMDRNEVVETLGQGFRDDHFPADWRTPDLSGELGKLPRRQEIGAWLESHPEVESFVILDDLGRSHFAELGERLVACSLFTGFTGELFAEALAKLSGKRPGS